MKDLKDYMRQAGDVTYADAHRTKRNEGTVEFASYKVNIIALYKVNLMRQLEIDHLQIRHV